MLCSRRDRNDREFIRIFFSTVTGNDLEAYVNVVAVILVCYFENFVTLIIIEYIIPVISSVPIANNRIFKVVCRVGRLGLTHKILVVKVYKVTLEVRSAEREPLCVGLGYPVCGEGDILYDLRAEVKHFITEIPTGKYVPVLFGDIGAYLFSVIHVLRCRVSVILVERNNTVVNCRVCGVGADKRYKGFPALEHTTFEPIGFFAVILWQTACGNILVNFEHRTVGVLPRYGIVAFVNVAECTLRNNIGIIYVIALFIIDLIVITDITVEDFISIPAVTGITDNDNEIAAVVGVRSCEVDGKPRAADSFVAVKNLYRVGIVLVIRRSV